MVEPLSEHGPSLRNARKPGEGRGGQSRCAAGDATLRLGVTGQQKGQKADTVCAAHALRGAQAGWARSVVTGRARLGGVPVGVIAVETQTVMLNIPADPGAPDSSERIIPQVGQPGAPQNPRHGLSAVPSAIPRQSCSTSGPTRARQTPPSASSPRSGCR